MLLGNTALGVGIIVNSGKSLTFGSFIKGGFNSIQQSPALTNQRALFHGLQGSEVTYAAQPLRLRGA